MVFLFGFLIPSTCMIHIFCRTPCLVYSFLSYLLQPHIYRIHPGLHTAEGPLSLSLPEAPLLCVRAAAVHINVFSFIAIIERASTFFLSPTEWTSRIYRWIGNRRRQTDTHSPETLEAKPAYVVCARPLSPSAPRSALCVVCSCYREKPTVCI